MNNAFLTPQRGFSLLNLLFLVFILFLTACGGGGGSSDDGPPPDGNGGGDNGGGSTPVTANVVGARQVTTGDLLQITAAIACPNSDCSVYIGALVRFDFQPEGSNDIVPGGVEARANEGVIDNGRITLTRSIAAPAAPGRYRFRVCLVLPGGGPCSNNNAIVMVSLPDPTGRLSLSAVSVSNTRPEDGAPLQLTTEASCAGGDCAADRIQFYRTSLNTNTDRSDPAGESIGREMRLQDGESAEFSQTTTAASGETYKYFACFNDDCSDLSDEVDAVSTGGSTPGTLTINSNLVVTGPAADGTADANQEIDLEAVLSCDGTEGDCPAGDVRFYRGNDPTNRNNPLGDARSFGAVIGNEKERVLTMTRLPAFSLGFYYYFACLELPGEAPQCSQSTPIEVSNEWKFAGFELMRAPGASGQIAPSEPISFTARTECHDPDLSDASNTCRSVTLSFHRSADSSVNRQDTPPMQEARLADMVGADMAGVETRTDSFNTAASPSPSTYYYGACLSAGANNEICAPDPGTEVIVVGSVSNAILVAGNFRIQPSSTVELGDSVNLNVTVSCDIQDCPADRIVFYRSEDSVIDRSDTEITGASYPVPVLNDGDEKPQSHSFMVDQVAYDGDYFGACLMTDQNPHSCSVGTPLEVVRPSVALDSFSLELLDNTMLQISIATTCSIDPLPCAPHSFRYFISTTADPLDKGARRALSPELSSTPVTIPIGNELFPPYIFACLVEGGEVRDVCAEPAALGAFRFNAPPTLVSAATRVHRSAQFLLQVGFQCPSDDTACHENITFYAHRLPNVPRSTTEIMDTRETGGTGELLAPQVGMIEERDAGGVGNLRLEVSAPADDGDYYLYACGRLRCSPTPSDISFSVGGTLNFTSIGSSAAAFLRGPGTGTNGEGEDLPDEFRLTVNLQCGGGDCDGDEVAFYRSEDEDIDNNSDVRAPLESAASLGILPADIGEERMVAANINEPFDLPAKTYYYGACLESDIHPETCSAPVQVTKRGHYLLKNFAQNVTRGAPNTPILISVDLECTDTAQCLTSDITFHQSLDPTISADDDEVGRSARIPRIPSGAVEEMHEVRDVVAPMDPGTYYYGACTEHRDGGASSPVTTNVCTRGAEFVVTGG